MIATGEGLNTECFDDAAQLTPHNLKRLASFALLQGFPHTEHRLQSASLSRSELAIQYFVAFAQYLATLRVPDQHQITSRIDQLTRSNLTGQRALLGLYRRILSTHGYRLALQTLQSLD